jgi:hypothetical protein
MGDGLASLRCISAKADGLFGMFRWRKGEEGEEEGQGNARRGKEMRGKARKAGRTG